MSQLFLPSAPWLGQRPGVWGPQESVGPGRAKWSLEGGALRGEEGVGGRSRMAVAGGRGGEGWPGAPSAPGRGRLEGVDLPSFDSGSPNPLCSAVHGGRAGVCVGVSLGPWGGGSRGGAVSVPSHSSWGAARPFEPDWTFGDGAAGLSMCICNPSPGSLAPRPHLEQ